MAIDIRMPALTATMEEASLVKWLVNVGDTVKAGQPVAEVETDKATMEIEAAEDGVVDEIIIEASGAPVKVNALLARIQGAGKAASPTSASAAAENPAPLMPEAAAQSVQMRYKRGNGRLMASPLARLIARQNNMDISRIDGTGPHGRILRRDVEACINIGGEVNRNRGEAALAPERSGHTELRPHNAMRKTIAARLTHAFRDIPHFSLEMECEVERLLSLKQELAKSPRFSESSSHGDALAQPSLNDFIVRAVALALMQVSDMNVSYSEEGLQIHRSADVAIAVSVADGLVTPIIRDAQDKTLGGIASEAKSLAGKAREGRLAPEDYTGGSFTVSNLGMYGVSRFNSILNPPHSGILSVGTARRRSVPRGDELVIAHVMSLTLTCDHRAVDGVIGANFLKALKDLLENPLGLLL